MPGAGIEPQSASHFSISDNLVVTHANAHLPHSPNVARSWSPRQIRVRAEERLARSVGDREQERKVLEWCKKHNVNVIRKLPKLDSTVLVSSTLSDPLARVLTRMVVDES